MVRPTVALSTVLSASRILRFLKHLSVFVYSERGTLAGANLFANEGGSFQSLDSGPVLVSAHVGVDQSERTIDEA